MVRVCIYKIIDPSISVFPFSALYEGEIKHCLLAKYTNITVTFASEGLLCQEN